MTDASTADRESLATRVIIAEHMRDTALGLMPPEVVAVLAAKLPLLHGIGTALHPTVELPESYSDDLNIMISGLERQIALFEGNLSSPFEHRYICLKCGLRNDDPTRGINCLHCGTNRYSTWVPIPIT